MDQSTQAVAEAFKIVTERYKQVYDEFVVFCRAHIYGTMYGDAVGHYIHDANRAYGNLTYALSTSEFPCEGIVDRRWKDYHDTIANTELMQMIMEFGAAKFNTEENIENTNMS